MTNSPLLRQTKIIATLGPASNTEEKIEQLARAGADVFRMNFSHGTHEEHAAVHRAIRKVEAKLGTSIAILADLQGPKLRIGVVPTGRHSIAAGDSITFGLTVDSDHSVPFPHPEIYQTLDVGHIVLIDDGRIRLRVTEANQTEFKAKALTPAVLNDRKGMNFPDTDLKVDAITEKDRNDLNFALGLGVDWIAMSFVQRAKDVAKLRDLTGASAKIMAKIEKPIAVEQIDDILDASDAVMVARGDLGVECDWHELPAIQSSLVTKARAKGKPVVVATQMLESMITSPLPTRAETSDVANAVTQGADAVMLSAESAAGDYPIEAVGSMVAIAAATERALRSNGRSIDMSLLDTPDVSRSIASAASVLAQLRDACCIATYTETGATALRVAHTRSGIPVLAVCPSEDIARPLNLVWGVTPVVNNDKAEFTSSREGHIPPRLAPKNLIQEGRAVVVTSGSKHGESGGTDSLKIAYLRAENPN